MHCLYSEVVICMRYVCVIAVPIPPGWTTIETDTFVSHQHVPQTVHALVNKLDSSVYLCCSPPRRNTVNAVNTGSPLEFIFKEYGGLVSEPAFGALTCYGESCASSLVATEGSCYNDGKFKFDRWTTANQVAL